MDKLELLERISKTTHFLDHANPEYMEIIKAMAETTNGLTLAYCLHMAYMAGHQQAMQAVRTRANDGIRWSKANMELALDFNSEIEKK